MDLLRSRALSVPTSNLQTPIASSAGDIHPVKFCMTLSLYPHQWQIVRRMRRLSWKGGSLDFPEGQV